VSARDYRSDIKGIGATIEDIEEEKK